MLSLHEIAMIESESRLFENSSTRAQVHRSWRWMPLTVFAASILVTLGFWKVLPNSFRLNESSDYSASYEPIARSVIAGRGFSRADGSPATAYPPGYSLVLAGVFELCHLLGISEAIGVLAISIMGMGLTTVFVFFLARMLWGILPALVSSMLWTTYPFALWLTKQPNSEIPFMAVFYCGLCLFWYALSRRKSAGIYFVVGVVFGSAMLIRPVAIGIGLVLSAVAWFARREITVRARALVIAMLLLGNLVTVLPWEAWAYAKTGKVILLGTNGVKSMRDGLTFAVEAKGYRQSNSTSADLAQVMDDFRVHENEITSMSDFPRIIFNEFRAHPIGMTQLVLLKLGRSWYGTDSQRLETPILLFQLAYLALVAWSARGAWRQDGLPRKFLISALLIAGYFWAMSFLALSILRYMVPVFGLLFVLVGGAIASRWSSIRRPQLETIR